MKIENQSVPFPITYNGKEYDVPSGFFDVNNEELGQFIIKKGTQWGHKIEMLGSASAPSITKIDSIPKEEPIKPVVEAEVKEETKTKTKK